MGAALGPGPSQGNRRAYALSLTEEGKRIVEEYRHVAPESEAALLALMCHPLVDSYGVANALLTELIDNFDELRYLREAADA